MRIDIIIPWLMITEMIIKLKIILITGKTNSTTNNNKWGNTNY